MTSKTNNRWMHNLAPGHVTAEMALKMELKRVTVNIDYQDVCASNGVKYKMECQQWESAEAVGQQEGEKLLKQLGLQPMPVRFHNTCFKDE